MPKRDDINSVLIIGSGPIVIGQACEFDYSGTQAIKALKEEGCRVILVNSNPATIMTDPDFADRTYIEPITVDYVEAIISKERPDALLPTMGGQTALNVTLELVEGGVLEKYDCALIGANIEAIKTAEDRALFRKAMDEIGLKSAKSGLAHSVSEAKRLAKRIGYPLILRPSRTLGGSGGGIVYAASELEQKVGHALAVSPNSEVLIEQSLVGWKEIELELMRDQKDNVVIVCSIENLDPMGVHTGDSITVAPVQTLTDKEYQGLRDAAIAVMRRIGVDTGGSNVQFAINPKSGEVIIIEMNPRVSRSSALASKATGFPIAKIAAKLAIGYSLDEIQNDITLQTPACFEPAIDYVVVKIPRFNFEKFPMADAQLGTQMKSVGEVMAFGRSFTEALQKAMCSMELDSVGFDYQEASTTKSVETIFKACKKTDAKRLWIVAEAIRKGFGVEVLTDITGIDAWFLFEIEALIHMEESLKKSSLEDLGYEEMVNYKREGFSDARIARLLGVKQSEVQQHREALGLFPSYRSVDTCAGEFIAHTPYLYSSYEPGHEVVVSKKQKVIILGSGPNRIGQGIEFDYCCVHALMALKEAGFEAIMVNCNPETVSTDYDISDKLYFEPLTLESVLAIVKREKPLGVIVQFGGQTPLKLAGELEALGVPILGTAVDSIDMAEDRERFTALVKDLGLKQPNYATARSLEEAMGAADKIGFPLMLRPSFVLGGRAMRIIASFEELKAYMQESVYVSNDRPVLLDKFLQNAIEVDVDAVADGDKVLIAGVMEHIERAGIHSGDSSCCLPPQSLSRDIIAKMKEQTRQLALALKVKGLINVQFAINQKQEIYILEVNPRASRTVPFVSKATGIQWAKVATKVIAGQSLADLGLREPSFGPHCAVKACVFPFSKFANVDTVLGPEMKSTGEVMGLALDFPGAFSKAQLASNVKLPNHGTAFLSVMDGDKCELPYIAEGLRNLKFSIVATKGTADFLNSKGYNVKEINKVREGSPHIVDALHKGDISLVINTPEGQGPELDSRSIRIVANQNNIPTYTTLASAQAAVDAIEKMKEITQTQVCALQDYY